MNINRVIAVIDPILEPRPQDGVLFRVFHDCEDWLNASQNDKYNEVWIIHDMEDRAHITTVIGDLLVEGPWERSDTLIVFMTDHYEEYDEDDEDNEIAKVAKALKLFHPVEVRPFDPSLFEAVPA